MCVTFTVSRIIWMAPYMCVNRSWKLSFCPFLTTKYTMFQISQMSYSWTRCLILVNWYLFIFLQEVAAVDDLKLTITSRMYMYMKWTDTRIRHNKTNKEELAILVSLSEGIWLGKGKTIAGVTSQFYHRIFIITVLPSQLYHRSLSARLYHRS